MRAVRRLALSAFAVAGLAPVRVRIGWYRRRRDAEVRRPQGDDRRHERERRHRGTASGHRTGTAGPAPRVGGDKAIPEDGGSQLPGAGQRDELGSNSDGFEDFMKGGSGDDVLDGVDGPDDLEGGADDDFLDGGNESDDCNGGSGTDIGSGLRDRQRHPVAPVLAQPGPDDRVRKACAVAHHCGLFRVSV